MQLMMLTLFLAAYLLACVYAGPTFLVGPTRQYQSPSDASSALVDGFTMIIDDGHYYGNLGIPQGFSSWTIKSASGNAYNCILDGQGGVGNGHKLYWGKGIIHAMSPGTVIGVGFINGGGADNYGDGEAGFYAESFNTLGTVNIVNCSFDGNENGIFVPGPGGNGQNINIVLTNSVFSYKAPNGVTSDGLSHDVYISAASFTSTNNIWLPSQYGNNLKSRAGVTYVADQYNRHNQGRCLDIASGGQLTVRGGVYSASGPGSVSNFFEYASENTASGVYTPDISGMTIVGSRYNDAIWNGVDSQGIVINFASTTQQWADSSATFVLRGAVTGIVTSPPAGATIVPIPQPTLPLWANPNQPQPTPAPSQPSNPSSTTSSGQNAPASTGANSPATSSSGANSGATSSNTQSQTTSSSPTTPHPATGASTFPPTKAPSASPSQAPQDNSASVGAFSVCTLVIALLVASL